MHDAQLAHVAERRRRADASSESASTFC